jgi:hypothetical protein
MAGEQGSERKLAPPSYSEGRGKRITVQGHPSRSMRLYLKNKLKEKGLVVWLKG